MGDADEFRTIRSRVAELQAAIDRRGGDRPDGQAAMVGKVFDAGSGVPTTLDKFFAVHPIDVGGAEVEGGSFESSVSSGVVYFICVGPKVPVAGDLLVADSVGGRWVAEHPGSSLTGCDQLIPRSLFLTDVNGTHALTYSTTAFRWTCCYTLTHPTTVVDNSTCSPKASGTIAVEYQLLCTTTPTPAAISTAALRQRYYQVPCDNDISGNPTTGPFSRTTVCTSNSVSQRNVETAATKDSQTNGPFSATFTMPTTGATFFNLPTPVSGPVVVSE